MKGLRLILALFLHLASGLSRVAEAEAEYPTCGILSKFTMKSAPSEVRSGDEFAFRLSTDFNDYTALCSGKWQYDWMECVEEDKDKESIAMFRGTSSGYLDITHRYPCKRLEEPHDVALGIANGTVSSTFLSRILSLPTHLSQPRTGSLTGHVPIHRSILNGSSTTFCMKLE